MSLISALYSFCMLKDVRRIAGNERLTVQQAIVQPVLACGLGTQDGQLEEPAVEPDGSHTVIIAWHWVCDQFRVTAGVQDCHTGDVELGSLTHC